jgi:hypothetical protein
LSRSGLMASTAFKPIRAEAPAVKMQNTSSSQSRAFDPPSQTA